MKKYIAVIIGFIGSCSFLFAQMKLPSEVKVSMPEFISNPDNTWYKENYGSYQEYVYRKIKEGDYASNQTNQHVWVVWSDRAENPVYSAPKGSEIGMLDFMEKVYIADMENGWAQVFTDDMTIVGNKINKTAKARGWIPVEKLLLWHKCPTTAQNILEKGLIVTDLEKVNSENTDMRFLKEPKENGQRSNMLATELDIPFIMKKEKVNGKTFYLLAKLCVIEDRGDIAKTMVNGWLSESFLTLWNQRLCLEPTSDEAVIEDLEDKGIYPPVFTKEMQAVDFMKTGNASQSVKDFKTTFENRERPHGYIMRTPILGTPHPDVYSAVVIGTKEEAEKRGVSEKDYANKQRQLEVLREKLNNVNVIFLLDATSSMRPYFPEISKAIGQIIRRDFSQNIKIGAVLYRNVADGAEEIKYYKVTSEVQNVADFILQATCFSKGSGYYESMFKGLETALDEKKLGYDPTANNFIIAIGDCGNEEDPKKMRELGTKLKRNNIHFFAYNVAVDDNPAYRRYKNQVTELLRLSIEDDLDKEECLRPTQREVFRIFYKEGGQCSSTPSSEHFGGARLATTDGNVAIDMFNTTVTETVMGFINDVNKQITMLSSGVTSESWNWDAVCKLMKSRGYWTDKDCEVMRANNMASKLLCYAPMKVKEVEPLFEYVLFFSYDELTKLVQCLKKTNPSKGTSSNYFSADVGTRKRYQDALVDLGAAFLGEDRNVVRGMDFEKFLQKIYGIPVKMNNCGIPSIQDITNSDRVSDEAFKNFASSFSYKLRALADIVEGEYTESFKLNTKLYYWVPFNSIPGYCAE